MAVPSLERYQIQFATRPVERDGVEDLLEDLYARIEVVRGRAYARWAYSRWKEQIEEQGAWIALAGLRAVGLLSVRCPSQGKGEMSLLYSREEQASVLLVEAAFDAFRRQGIGLVTTAFQGWSQPLGGEVPQAGEALDRLGFRGFEVCVLEADPARVTRRAPPVAPYPFRIRPLGAADISVCARIMSSSPDLLMEEVRYPPEECEIILRKSAGAEGRFLADLAGVALAPDGSISAFATAGANGVVGQVYVLAPFRRRGLARLLVDRALRGLAKRGVDRAILTVIRGNEAGFRLYRALGFVEAYSYPLRYWKGP